MPQRRSITQALSTKEIDFLKQPLRQTTPTVDIQEVRKPLVKHEATGHAPEPNVEEAAPTKRARKSIERSPPAAASEQWVPLSTRVPKSLQRRLRRVSLERQERSITPNSIQNMIVEATEAWLQTQK